MADIAEGISSLFHLLGVGVDGEITLGHGVKLLTEDDGAGLLVRPKEVGDGDVEITAV